MNKKTFNILLCVALLFPSAAARAVPVSSEIEDFRGFPDDNSGGALAATSYVLPLMVIGVICVMWLNEDSDDDRSVASKIGSNLKSIGTKIRTLIMGKQASECPCGCQGKKPVCADTMPNRSEGCCGGGCVCIDCHCNDRTPLAGANKCACTDCPCKKMKAAVDMAEKNTVDCCGSNCACIDCHCQAKSAVAGARTCACIDCHCNDRQPVMVIATEVVPRKSNK